jgi:hypothetical protein
MTRVVTTCRKVSHCHRLCGNHTTSPPLPMTTAWPRHNNATRRNEGTATTPPDHTYQRRPHSHVTTTRHDVTTTRRDVTKARQPHHLSTTTNDDRASHVTTTRHDVTKAGGNDLGRDGPSCPSLTIGMMIYILKIIVLTNYTQFAVTTTWPGGFYPSSSRQTILTAANKQ